MLGNIDAGVKFSTPWKIFNMALRLEAHYPHLGLITPMIGFGSEAREYVTLGVEQSLNPDFSSLLFTTLHPLKNFHIFVGARLFQESFPPLSIGLGYTYTFPPGANKERIRDVEEKMDD